MAAVWRSRPAQRAGGRRARVSTPRNLFNAWTRDSTTARRRLGTSAHATECMILHPAAQTRCVIGSKALQFMTARQGLWTSKHLGHIKGHHLLLILHPSEQVQHAIASRKLQVTTARRSPRAITYIRRHSLLITHFVAETGREIGTRILQSMTAWQRPKMSACVGGHHIPLVMHLKTETRYGIGWRILGATMARWRLRAKACIARWPLLPAFVRQRGRLARRLQASTIRSTSGILELSAACEDHLLHAVTETVQSTAQQGTDDARIVVEDTTTDVGNDENLGSRTPRALQHGRELRHEQCRVRGALAAVQGAVSDARIPVRHGDIDHSTNFNMLCQRSVALSRTLAKYHDVGTEDRSFFWDVRRRLVQTQSHLRCLRRLPLSLASRSQGVEECRLHAHSLLEGMSSTGEKAAPGMVGRGCADGGDGVSAPGPFDGHLEHGAGVRCDLERCPLRVQAGLVATLKLTLTVDQQV
mmetsp:Transcript_69080/g.225213  ORF Transcript_69080/g.225213 Transcript_69080/m.225213 type:complete len:472 (-) Transcript_69080:1431-2846(-)